MTFAIAGCAEHDPPTAGHAVRRAFEGGATMPLALEADLPVARLDLSIEDAAGTREMELRREDEKGLLVVAVDIALLSAGLVLLATAAALRHHQRTERHA